MAVESGITKMKTHEPKPAWAGGLAAGSWNTERQNSRAQSPGPHSCEIPPMVFQAWGTVERTPRFQQRWGKGTILKDAKHSVLPDKT